MNILDLFANWFNKEYDIIGIHAWYDCKTLSVYDIIMCENIAIRLQYIGMLADDEITMTLILNNIISNKEKSCHFSDPDLFNNIRMTIDRWLSTCNNGNIIDNVQ